MVFGSLQPLRFHFFAEYCCLIVVILSFGRKKRINTILYGFFSKSQFEKSFYRHIFYKKSKNDGNVNFFKMDELYENSKKVEEEIIMALF